MCSLFAAYRKLFSCTIVQYLILIQVQIIEMNRSFIWIGCNSHLPAWSVQSTFHSPSKCCPSSCTNCTSISAVTIPPYLQHCKRHFSLLKFQQTNHELGDLCQPHLIYNGSALLPWNTGHKREALKHDFCGNLEININYILGYAWCKSHPSSSDPIPLFCFVIVQLYLSKLKQKKVLLWKEMVDMDFLFYVSVYCMHYFGRLQFYFLVICQEDRIFL